MPRMREAIRSGWKTSKSSSFSPVDANMIGRPVSCATDSAAPPRASPSSLVSTTPSKPTPSRNACAVVTASWPIIASTTNRISSGIDGVADVGGLLHQLLVDAEPAGGVDDHDVVQLCAGPRAIDVARDRRPDRRRRCRARARRPATPACSPTTCSCWTALGRCRSAATSSGAWPCDFSQRAELAGQRGLTGALQTGQHDHGRRGLGEAEPAGLAAEDRR